MPVTPQRETYEDQLTPSSAFPVMRALSGTGSFTATLRKFAMRCPAGFAKPRFRWGDAPEPQARETAHMRSATHCPPSKGPPRIPETIQTISGQNFMTKTSITGIF